ncbi:MAG: lasso peptide biosynthesis PqqD family chaperone [Bacillota bacterium]
MEELITLDTIIVANKKVVTADMDGETVMLNVATGKYHSLGKTGSIIWELLQRQITVEQLIGELQNKYQVARQQCEAETLAFLDAMNKEGILEIG